MYSSARPWLTFCSILYLISGETFSVRNYNTVSVLGLATENTVRSGEVLSGRGWGMEVVEVVEGGAGG